MFIIDFFFFSIGVQRFFTDERGRSGSCWISRWATLRLPSWLQRGQIVRRYAYLCCSDSSQNAWRVESPSDNGVKGRGSRLVSVWIRALPVTLEEVIKMALHRINITVDSVYDTDRGAEHYRSHLAEAKRKKSLQICQQAWFLHSIHG